MNIHGDIAYLNALIAELLITHPELADDEELRADTFEGETDLHNVLTKLVSMAMDAASFAEAIKARGDDLAERRKRFTNKEASIRGLIQSILERANLPKVQLLEATLSIRQIAPSPIVTDADLLPDTCVKIERKPDMAAIKEAMSTGEVPGIAMSNGKTSLTIRTK